MFLYRYLTDLLVDFIADGESIEGDGDSLQPHRRRLSLELDREAEARALEEAAASFKRAAHRREYGIDDDESDEGECLPTPEDPGIWRVKVKVSGRHFIISNLSHPRRTVAGGMFCS